MKREKYKQLFEVTWEKNEKTGKPGAWPATSASATPWTWRSGTGLRPWLLGEGRGGRGGIPGRRLINSMGSHCPWVMPFYGLSILPILYFTLAAVRVARLKPVVDEIALDGSVLSARRCAARHAGPGRTVDGGGCCFFAVLRVRGAAGPGIGLFGRRTGHRGGRRVGAASAKGAPTPGNTPVRFPFLRRAGTKLDETCRFYGHWKGIQA